MNERQTYGLMLLLASALLGVPTSAGEVASSEAEETMFLTRTDELARAATDTCESPEAGAGLRIQESDALSSSGDPPCCTCLGVGKPSCQCLSHPCQCLTDATGACHCMCGGNPPLSKLQEICERYHFIHPCPFATLTSQSESALLSNRADQV